MLTTAGLVVMLDVDNTLLDNDRFGADLSAWFDQAFGVAERQRYWAIYAELRKQLGYADYLGALQRFRTDSTAQAQLQRTADFLLEYPFEQRLYPDVLATIAHLATLATVVIVSDGDIVFQPRKIRRSGLAAAVGERVLIYLRKQDSLEDLQQRFPARHYLMVDDKPLLLAAMKRGLGSRLSTVFVRQGHYAAESLSVTIDPPPDYSFERIGELLTLARSDLLAEAAKSQITVPESQ